MNLSEQGVVVPMVLFGIVALFSGIGLFLYFYFYPRSSESQTVLQPLSTPIASISGVVDFASCVAAGNPVQESYPRKCSADGKSFTEIISSPMPVVSSETTYYTINLENKKKRLLAKNVEVFSEGVAAPVKSKSFTLDIPENWSFEGGLFVDEENRKVGEFLPGVMYLPSETHCFESSFFKNGRSQILLETAISTSKYSGKLRVEQIEAEGGSPSVWYPYNYCLEHLDLAFVVTFYSLVKEDEMKKTIFKEIIDSFQFSE